MKRFGQVIGVKRDQIDAYERIHASVWPEVLETIHKANIRNYTIFRYESLLFAYFEYVGVDYELDMAKVAAGPKTQEWWTYTAPMQEQVGETTPGEWWTNIKEVFHVD